MSLSLKLLCLQNALKIWSYNSEPYFVAFCIEFACVHVTVCLHSCYVAIKYLVSQIVFFLCNFSASTFWRVLVPLLRYYYATNNFVFIKALSFQDTVKNFFLINSL